MIRFLCQSRRLLLNLIVSFCSVCATFGAELPDFRSTYRDGAEHQGEIFLTIKLEESGIASALNMLRFGPKNFGALHTKLKGTRKDKFLFAKEHLKKSRTAKSGHSIRDFFQWIDQDLPAERNLNQLGLTLVQLPGDMELEGVETLFRNSLRNGVPVILALERYAIEPKGGGLYLWQRKMRHFVLLSKMKLKSEDPTSFGISLLDPIQNYPGLTEALLVRRPGEEKARIATNPTGDPLVNLAGPHLSIHGGDLENWQADTWAQRCVTVPAWAIVMKGEAP